MTISTNSSGNHSNGPAIDDEWDTELFFSIFPRTFLLKYSPITKEHRLEVKTKGEFPPNGSIFRKLIQALHPTQFYSGTPIQWRVQTVNFKLMLGARGRLTMWPSGRAPDVARTLYDFLTMKAGFTDEEFIEFVHRLYLFRIELANQVDENGKKVLKKGTMVHYDFSAEDGIFPPAKGKIHLDESDDVLEEEISGTTPEAKDIHMLAIRPLQGAGHIRAIRAEQLRQKGIFEDVISKVNEIAPFLTQAEKGIIQRVDQQWRALSSLERQTIININESRQAVTTLTEIKEKIDALESTPGLTAKDYKIGVSRIVNALGKLGNRFEDQITDVQDIIEEKNTEAELRHTELCNDMAEQHLEEKILITGVLDQARQNNRDIKQVDLHLQIYAEGILENQREIKRLLLGYHQGQIYQTAFITRRIQALDDRMASMADVMASLAKHLNMTLADLVKLTSDTRDAIEHARQEMGGNRIHQDSLNYLSLALILLGKFPALVVKRIAEHLGVKPTRVYGLVNKLEELGFVTREKQVPDVEPQGDLNSSGAGSAQGSGSRPEEPHEPAKKKLSLRRVWHYFRRTTQSESETQSNKQLKPEDEKT